METKSLFYKDQDAIITSKDENGNTACGTRMFIDENDKQIIVRFNNGFLDGDSYSEDGTVTTQPAVECDGHLEYWRKGKLHRDNGLAAVSTNGFSESEYWENGVRIR